MSELVPVSHDPQRAPTLTRVVAGPQELIAYHKELGEVVNNNLQKGTDIIVIPGTDKPTLAKAGAERLCIAFGCHPEYELASSEVDHNHENKYDYWDKKARERKAGTSFGLYRFSYKCRIVRNSDSQVIGECIGSCSTLESKYISRPRDAENTAVKMAQKRAFVGATLHAFGLSDRFTQDMEDAYGHEGSASSAGNSQPRSNQPRQATPVQAQAKPVAQVMDTSQPAWVERLNAAFDKRGVAADLRPGLLATLNGKVASGEILDAAIDAAQKAAKTVDVVAEQTTTGYGE